MTTASQIDAAMRNFAIDVAFGDQAQRIKSGDALRDLIAAALAEARRDGAEAMRAESAKLARALPLYYGSGDDGADESLAQAIEDLPLPTGERQAELLTDAEVKRQAEEIERLKADLSSERSAHEETRLARNRARLDGIAEARANLMPEMEKMRGALLWALWHKQGGGSPIGQPIRRALGIRQFEALTPEQVKCAKRFGEQE